MTLARPDRRFLCSVRKEKGPAVCANGRGAKADEVEVRVLDAIKQHLLEPAVIEEALREYNATKNAAAASASGQRAHLEKRLADVRRRAERLVDQVADGVLEGATVRDRLGAFEAQRVALTQKLAELASTEGPS